MRVLQADKATGRREPRGSSAPMGEDIQTTHVHKESQDPFLLEYPANSSEYTAAKKGGEL